MKVDKRMILVAAAAFALAFFVAQGGSSPIPNPFAPARPDRPVLKLIARAAKSLLWIAVFAEEKPADPQYNAHAAVDSSGHQLINHAEGW